MKKSLIFLIAAFVPAVVSAADWRYIGYTTDAIYSVDTQSVRLGQANYNRGFQARRGWFKKTALNDVDGYELLLVSVNCTADEILTLQWTKYGSDGAAITSGSREDFDFNYRATNPESIGETMLGFLCGRISLNDL